MSDANYYLHDAVHILRSNGTIEHAKACEEAVKELEALRQFKAYVHERLDDAGIPTHPEGEHSKAGCRVGDRLDIALEQWPEWAEKLLRLLESWGAEYEADDEINLPDELSEWLHHYASDIKLTAERKHLQKERG